MRYSLSYAILIRFFVGVSAMGGGSYQVTVRSKNKKMLEVRGGLSGPFTFKGMSEPTVKTDKPGKWEGRIPEYPTD